MSFYKFIYLYIIQLIIDKLYINIYSLLFRSVKFVQSQWTPPKDILPFSSTSSELGRVQWPFKYDLPPNLGNARSWWTLRKCNNCIQSICAYCDNNSNPLAMQYFIANKMKKLNIVHRRTRLNKLRQNHATYAILSLLGKSLRNLVWNLKEKLLCNMSHPVFVILQVVSIGKHPTPFFKVVLPNFNGRQIHS